MRDDEKIGINGRIVSEETLVRICGLIARPLIEGTGQNQESRRRSIHELARLIGVGVVTNSVAVAGD